jgi:hypothetical protein
MMSISEELNSLILQRKSIEGDVDYENNQVIQDEIQLMIKDINATVSFLENDCTEEQFIWLSEVFDEIAERSKSSEFIAAIRRAAKRFPQAVATYNINYFIDSAAEYIN